MIVWGLQRKSRYPGDLEPPDKFRRLSGNPRIYLGDSRGSPGRNLTIRLNERREHPTLTTTMAHSSSLDNAESADDLKELKPQRFNGLKFNPSDFDPALLTEMEEDRDCCAADGKLERCCSHCWFLMTCLTCYVYSSLLRLVVVVDLTVTLVLFIHHVKDEGDFISKEVTHYDFGRSAIYVMILSAVKNSMLFFCFAYKFQTYHSTFITATTLTTFSAVFLGIKMAFCDPNTSAFPITLYSLVMGLTNYFLYGCVRRRRIRVPPRKLASMRQDYEKLTAEGRESDELDTVTTESGISIRERLKSIPDGQTPLSLADAGSKFVNLDGVQVHYRFSESKGKDTNKPAIVFLHGFGGSVFSWKKIWSKVASSANCRVLAFDRPGFGLTSRPLQGEWEHNPYTQQFSLMLLFKLMDYLGIHKAYLVGHGSGGALAVLAAAMRPTRISRLMLVSPAIYTSGFPSFLRSLFRTRLGKSIVTDLVRSEMGELLLR
eukprot:536273-Amorphochlora_amoeboformis.AAC.2